MESIVPTKFFALAALAMAPISAAWADKNESAPSLSVADTRPGLAGQWQGKLEYRDYQADRWFGLPLAVTIEDVGDGATLIQKSSYNDGPATGTVTITAVSLLAKDGATEHVGSFRADRPAEMDKYTLSKVPPAAGTVQDATHWVIRSVSDGRDDNRPARIRETTTRNGNSLVTLKEVDFSDDDKQEWLPRNRTTLERVNKVSIRIYGFECGDNCYLNYTDLAVAGGISQSALCNVDACEAWFEDQTLPQEIVGLSASITLGMGTQYDNDGNRMSDNFPRITSITVDPAE